MRNFRRIRLYYGDLNAKSENIPVEFADRRKSENLSSVCCIKPVLSSYKSVLICYVLLPYTYVLNPQNQNVACEYRLRYCLWRRRRLCEISSLALRIWTKIKLTVIISISNKLFNGVSAKLHNSAQLEFLWSVRNIIRHTINEIKECQSWNNNVRFAWVNGFIWKNSCCKQFARFLWTLLSVLRVAIHVWVYPWPKSSDFYKEWSCQGISNEIFAWKFLAK